MKFHVKNKGALVFKSAHECKRLKKALSNDFRADIAVVSLCTVSDGMQLDFKKCKVVCAFSRERCYQVARA